MRITVNFPGSRDAFEAGNLQVFEREFNHEIASFVTSDSGIKRFTTGAPVLIEWGDTTYKNFVGYIHHMEPSYGSGLARVADALTKVYCIGASLVCRDQYAKSWDQITPGGIVRDCVTSLLSLDVEEGQPISIYRGAQETTWEFLARMAKMLGYTLYCRGTDLRMLSYDTVVARTGAALSLEWGSSLREFRSQAGSQAPRGGRLANVSASRVDPRTGQVISVAGALDTLPDSAVLFQEVDVGTTFETAGEGTQWVSRKIIANQWYRSATVLCGGNTRLEPQTYVYVSGVDRQNEGYWYVHECHHILDAAKSTYTAELKLGMNSETPPRFNLSTVNTGGPESLVSWRTGPDGVSTSMPPKSVLVQGVWRSTWT